MEIVIAFLIFITFLGTQYPTRDNPQGRLEVTQATAGAQELTMNYQVKPLSEFSFQNIIKQQYDYSCGSAALATLLNYHLGESFSEHQVIQGLMQYGEIQKIEERRAFSMLDMKRFVEVLGYQASGYRAEFEDLEKLKNVAIVPIEIYGYKHFVVFKGVFDGHVFLADPNVGNISFPKGQFLKLWTPNIAFIVSTDTPVMSALRLKEEDLRYVDLDYAANSIVPALPLSVVSDREQFIETSSDKRYFHDEDL
ncbi:MAG TPA: C39 family peptidase [Deltaproteobacteria bacterium]|nr:C39 family peptidase [Deltaproteobacteria bacterium]